MARAKVDLDRPLLVLAVGNEEDMRALLPKYWESRNSVRPASVMVSSSDYSLVAIRADLKAEGQLACSILTRPPTSLT